MEKQQFKEKENGKAVEAVECRASLTRKRKRSNEVSPQTQMEVFTYLYERSVETAFQYQIEKYMLFNYLLYIFTENGISEDEVMKKMNILLQGHGELLLGLERFLYSYYELKINAKLMNALNFITKVKERYGGESKKYNTFRSILTSYKNNTAFLIRSIMRLSEFSEAQHDLLEEFTKFLPLSFNKKNLEGPGWEVF